MAGYFWVTDEYGVPIDGVRVTWDYVDYTGPGYSLSSGVSKSFYTKGYYLLDDGRPINLYPPVTIDTYEGSDLVFSFFAEGYYQAMFASRVPFNTDGASSFYQSVVMRRW